MNNLKEKLKSTSKFLSEKAKQGIDKFVEGKEKIEAKIEQRKNEKQLEKDIMAKFNENAMKYRLITEGDKITSKTIYARTDYENRLLTLYSEVSIPSRSYFIDSQNQKFSVKMIRQNQTIELSIGETTYIRPATIIDFDLHSDEKTKEEMVKIINTSINISDSKIVKSNLGNE